MKVILSVIALSFSLSAFASLTKTDSGYVSWTVKINKKKEGVLTYSRSQVQIGGTNSTSPAETSMAARIAFDAGVGGRSEIPMTFTFSDERSQESVEAKIKEIVAKDIADVAVTGQEAEVKLSNLSCEESGFLKKKLTCSANFEHVQVLDLN